MLIRRRLLASIPALAALAALAAPARAADFAVAAEGGYYDMTSAKSSAEALFGSSGGATFGLFARTSLGRSLFVGAGARLFNRSGERAFAASKDAPAFSLGHPLEARILPVYALVGYRFAPESRLSPYAAVGAGLTSYREESTVAGITTTESKSSPSAHLAVGLEYGRGTVRAGVEAMYMTVPGIIGDAGISRVYEESNVGGLSITGRVVFVP